MSHSRTIEFWREVRELVERGLSLKKASKQFGLSYSNLSQRAQIEGWQLCYRGRPRAKAAADEGRREQMALEQRRYQEAQEALEHEASVLVIDVRKAELLTEKVLKQHSVRLKIALSEWAVKTAEKLRASEGRLRDEAAAMLAIRAIGNQLYHWDNEPDVGRMRSARSVGREQVKSLYEHWRDGTEPPECTGAVNLALIATTPQQLAEMAGRKADLDGHSRPSATESNDLSVGPSAIAPQQPTPAIHGEPSPEKEAPPLPVNQPVQPRRETAVELPPPLSPQERRRQELEELALLRAEWRGRR